MNRRILLITLLAFVGWWSSPVMAIEGAEPTGSMKMDMPGEQDLGQDNRMETAHPQKGDITETEQSLASRRSKWIGMKVVSSSNEDLGSVKNIIIDPDGRIIYLIIAHGGVLGIGNRLTPVPYSVVNPNHQFKEGKVLLDVNRKELEAAPRIESSEWPDFPDHEREVNAYYGSKPSPSCGNK